MAYIGRSPVIGSFKKIDDLTSQFNGAQTVFTLLSNGSGVDPGTSQNLLVSLGGVLQEPVTAYTVSGSTITFSSAPANTQSFFAVQLGDALDVGYLTQGVSIDVTNVNAAGIMDVAGDATFSSNVEVLGYLTVGNNTITMNSTTLVLGNTSANMVLHSAGITMNGVGIVTASGASNNALHLEGQTASFYTNASNLSTGTLPLGRLDANVLLTTSTTGINASALSSGTIPVERLTAANVTSNGIVTTGTQTFEGNKTFDADVTITGNLTLIGQATNLNVNNVIVTDSLIQLAANNTTSDALDIGLYGNYNPDGGDHEHTGLFRDASDGVWKLFVGLQDAPNTTINTSGTGYTIGTLQSYLTSAIFGTNSSALTITANSSYSATLTVNTVTAQTFTGNLTGTSSNATNLNSQPGSYYTNASNLDSGTVPLARLSSANSSANGIVDTTTQTFAGNKTFQNAASFSNTLSVTGAATLNGAIDANNKLTLNTTNGRFVLPVGADKWAT